MKTIPYFSYGSNLNLRQMKHRCPGAEPVVAATLRDHRLVFRSPNGGRGVATVEPDESSSVPGGVYLITREDLRGLDVYEGWPRLYRREVFVVDADDGRSVRALAYVMNEPARDAEPGFDYLSGIAEGYEDWEIPTDGLDVLADEVGIWRRVADGR